MPQRPYNDYEKKWQHQWEKDQTYRADTCSKAPKFYGLIEFPYPSGEGLHTGHGRPFIGIDVLTRKHRMQGENVMYPIGWDAFGLPTENFAIKHKMKPVDVTRKNVANMKRQLFSQGVGFDWSREINTTDPSYVKWTQWQFLKFFDSWYDEDAQRARPISELPVPSTILLQGDAAVRAYQDDHRLAFKATSTINWCPKDKIGLANEEAQGGVCERCGTVVEKREKEQWMIRITKYADRLLNDLDNVDYLEKIKIQQRNWIGKSDGAQIEFPVQDVSKIVLATNNVGKVARVKKCLSSILPNVEVLTLKEAGLSSQDVVEGSDLEANARAKASAYAGKTDLPIMGMDTGFFIDGEDADPAAPKRNALGGVDESTLSQSQIAEKMDAYYRSIATRRGGEVDAYWKDFFVVRFADGSERIATSIRPVVLTDKRFGEMDIFFPVRGLYRVKANNKYIAEQTEEEELTVELAPYRDALVRLCSTSIQVFTTRPNTLFGVTYLVLAPEHALVDEWINQGRVKNVSAVEAYRAAVRRETDMERTAERREKTGVPLEGMIATNPINGERISVWIADYVLANYGTGAVMAVPAHDERDFAFAKKFALPIKQVVAPYFSAPEGHKDAVRADRPTVRRQTIQAFVKHWNEDKYLCLDWKHFGWHSGVIGGIDEGEDAITAATREIIEETGYQHLRFVKLLGGEIHKNFFAAHKNENRYAVSVGLLFELVDGAHVDPEPEQIKNHDAVWVAADKMRSFLSLNDAVYMWDALITGNECFAGDGLAVHSGFLNELPTWKAKEEVTSWLMEHGYGKKQITFKLRDWVFSRQRYWGEPIPIVRCAKCGHVPLPEDQLPLTLPDVAVYEPTDTGESPLANVRSWVETTCPRCGGPAERETDTMPNWAGSSWYFLRYCDPQNDRALADPEALKYWMPIDLYNGGMEHTTLHLLYSRFWHKFLWDLNIVPRECGNEPYARRHSHGLVLAEGGEKMSKSKGNVVNPDDVVREYGADAFRLYIMFMGPFEQSVPWDTNGLEGVRKFLDKVWNLGSIVARESKVEPSLLSLYHQTIKKVSEGIDRLQFNTCVSALMILVNAFQDAGEIPTECRDGFLQLLAPFAPHIAEELWHALGHKDSIHRSGWPIFDPNLLQEETFELVIQINGKVRDRVKMSRDTSEEEVKTQIMSLPKVQTWVEGKTLKQIVYVKGKLVNIVVD